MKCYSGPNLPRTHARPVFGESWLNHHYGMEFGERYHLDPIFRTEQDRQAMRVIHERFGSLGIGDADPRPRPHLDICGHRFVPALLGCEIVYQDSQPAASRHLSLAPDGGLVAIERPDFDANRWAEEFRHQGRVLVERYGSVDAEINYGGPANVASNVLGTEAFVLLADPTPEFRSFLRMIAEVCIEAYDVLTVPFSSDPIPGRRMFLGNCPVGMLSPKTYRDEVLPHDQYIRSQVRHLGLHHCGIMDSYLADYASLEPLEYIEVGWGSDARAVRGVFPDVVVDLQIAMPAVQRMSPEELREELTELVRNAKPASLIRDIWMEDIGPEVPDDVVVNFVESVDAAMSTAAN